MQLPKYDFFQSINVLTHNLCLKSMTIFSCNVCFNLHDVWMKYINQINNRRSHLG